MNLNPKELWETYTQSWNATHTNEKRALFEQCLDMNCNYNDPLIKTHGWNELLNYMLEFHQQLPGARFITTYFLEHHNKSIARWEMRNADNLVLGDGISYGEYAVTGKLITMTGFFEPPPSQA